MIKNKKFQTRVEHLRGIYFTVQYAYWRFIPNWNNICVYEEGENFQHECWKTKTFTSLESAEKFAAKFKTIEDIRNWYEPMETRCRNFYKKNS